MKNSSKHFTLDKNNNICGPNSLYLKLNPDLKKENNKKFVYNKTVIFEDAKKTK
jgi:hypothetical protein